VLGVNVLDAVSGQDLDVVYGNGAGVAPRPHHHLLRGRRIKLETSLCNEDRPLTTSHYYIKDFVWFSTLIFPFYKMLEFSCFAVFFACIFETRVESGFLVVLNLFHQCFVKIINYFKLEKCSFIKDYLRKNICIIG
jgi:hypothetical protein